jgi:hypothetical protein
MSHAYHRAGILEIKDVLPYVSLLPSNTNNKDIHYHTFFGISIRMTSSRLRLFATKGVECIVCGLVGTFFAVEKHVKSEGASYHLNLYGYDSLSPLFRKEVMLTQDHIIPKSLGGKQNLNNLQVMCEFCNAAKGNKIIDATSTRNCGTCEDRQSDIRTKGKASNTS